MKRKFKLELSLLLVSSLLILMFLPASVQYNANAAELIYGDVNGDKAVDAIDFALLKSYLIGNISKLPVENWNESADVNLDGSVDAVDFSLIKSLLMGKISSLPVGIETPIAPQLTKNAEGLMTYSGLTVVSYGGYLNGESFQQEGIISYKGYQYTAFWNTNRSVVMARRALPNGGWEKFEFTDYHNTENDAHNTISLGVCPNDGTLHLAFDHHGNDLHYRKSNNGFLDNPTTSKWEASSFGKVTSALAGSKVTLVTYPKFVTTPQGNMLLEYRYGTSGSGDQHLYEYNGTSHTWQNIGKYIDGITNSINAYPHGLAFDKNNRLHMTWCWRETPDATTNHDLLYIYSEDNGRTWKNNVGNNVAKTGSSYITKNSEGIKVFTINQNRGLINQEDMSIDYEGRIHVLLSHMPDSQADNSNFTTARTKSTFFHYWRDTNGNWNRTNMGFPVVSNFRGKLAVSAANNLYAILPDLRITAASAATKWTDWKLVDTQSSGKFFSDPLIDKSRLKLEGDKLTILYPQKSSPNISYLDYAIK